MRRTKSYRFLTSVLLALLLTCAFTLASAQTFQVLHTFQGPDGAGPQAAPVIVDRAGDIYGTTDVGGAGNCRSMGCGTAFVLNKSGKEIALHSFRGPDGAFPEAGLLRDSRGNIFGTTDSGGSESGACGGEGGCGVAFRFSPKGKEVEYKFQGAPDGDGPQGSLVEDASGNFYGTTEYGGEYQFGTVFKIDGTTGKESVLYSFTGGGDGGFPFGVILDSTGDLYGVAQGGGCCDSGVAFKIDPAGNETVLADLDYPDSVLLLDSQGNLYGTTAGGGHGTCTLGCGTVFELLPQPGGNWSDKTLYEFCSLPNCIDGQEPVGGLVRDSQGNLLGTTIRGGSYQNCLGSGEACGVVFKLDPAGNETVLHNFSGGSDGAFPDAGLATDTLGSLYGTTQAGGASCYGQYTCGTIFKITP